ncbi:MAG: hypothetical protein CMF42_05840 [Legionellales bacterium]|nr:hypothetical protein [Legionellales bacterium]OUX66933.1 MAG: hypothetical protein CBD38_04185 [bacterium TMED178]|tara:strand:- start:537 stop:1037 length:501 start_codon:yes stop_codon:yes gene_type:complete
MKLIRYVAAGLILTSQCVFAAQDNPKFGVVDVRQIVEGSAMMKTMAQDLEKQFNPQKEALVKLQKQLEESTENLEKNKATMSPKDRKALEDSINDQRNQLAQSEQKFRSEVYQAQNESIGKIMDQVKVKVSEIASKKGIDVVFSSNEIIWSNPKIDLTNEVEKKLK